MASSKRILIVAACTGNCGGVHFLAILEVVMSEPKAVDNKPVVLELEAGTYYWCACGYSAKHPFCDGSHKAHGITPVKFELVEKGTVALCACKKTGKAPFCDGSHNRS